MGVGDGARGYAGGKAILSDTLITGQVGYALTLSDPNIDPHLARLQTTSNGLYATALTGGVISARTHTLHATSSEGIDGDSISESAVALTGQGRA